jgi:hypothetical protein
MINTYGICTYALYRVLSQASVKMTCISIQTDVSPYACMCLYIHICISLLSLPPNIYNQNVDSYYV